VPESWVRCLRLGAALWFVRWIIGCHKKTYTMWEMEDVAVVRVDDGDLRGESLNDQDDGRFDDRLRTADGMHCSCALLQFLSTFHGRKTDVRAPYYDLTLSKRYIYPPQKSTKSEHIVESQLSHLVTIYGTLFIAHVTYTYVCMYVRMTTGVDYYQGVLSVYYADIPPWTTLTKYGNSLNVITKRSRLNQSQQPP
jgi:hypothetical protein